MPARQSIIAIAPATVTPPAGRRRPMTSKQAKKAHAKATKVTKMTKAEQRRMEAEELAEQKKEFERERALARARGARERKAAKEEELKQERKKAGVPEKSRWVRPSQGRITGFLGLGKRAREEEAEGGEEAENQVHNFEESATKRIALDCEEEEIDEDEAEMERQMGKAPEVRGGWDNISEDEEQPQLEEPKLPAINQDLIDFRDDDEIFEELAAQQLQSETSAAVERSEAAAHPSLTVGAQSTSEHSQKVLNQSPTKPPSATHAMAPEIRPPSSSPRPQAASPISQGLPRASHAMAPAMRPASSPPRPQAASPMSQGLPRATHAMAPAIRPPGSSPRPQAASPMSQGLSRATHAMASAMHPPSSSPRPQAASPMSQGLSRAKMQFACSGMSPELTSSNPFSQQQTMLRSVDENVSRPTKAVATPVMGPPGRLARCHVTPSKSISSQGKQLPVSRAIASLSQRNPRGPVANLSIHHRPLSDITIQAQNIPAKALVTPATHSKSLLKSSLNSSNLAPKPSPFDLPTSTQLFLADHLDDFFPSPSQEMRELLDDIGDDDLPSNTQIAREIELDDVPVQLPPVMEPANPIPNDDFSWLSTQDLLISSQELRELETPSKAPPPPTPWDVRKARKPRFFVEKDEDLLAAAIYESKVQARRDEEAEKLRIENMRIERELHGTRREWQRPTQRVTRSSQAAAEQSKMSQQAPREVNPVKTSQQKKPILVAEEDDYGDNEYGDDDFDDAEAEASMIALVDEAEKKLAPVKNGSDYGDDEDDEYDYGPCDDYEFNCGPYYSRNGELHIKTHWAQGTRYERR